jgi:hypothetical protein
VPVVRTEALAARSINRGGFREGCTKQMSLDPRWIWSELINYIRDFPAAFPADGESWSDALTAFFYCAGLEEGYEVRCGDWSRRWENNRAGVDEPPARYARLSRAWRVNGLLDIDLCWVSPGFSILQDSEGQQAPCERRILLAFEHEDNTYTDRRGTDLKEVLDEIRKIGSIRTCLKVVSFFSSRSEAEDVNYLRPIQAEIGRVREAASLTDSWIVLQFCRYPSPRSWHRLKVDRSVRIYIRGTQLRGDGSDPQLIGEEMLKPPG